MWGGTRTEILFDRDCRQGLPRRTNHVNLNVNTEKETSPWRATQWRAVMVAILCGNFLPRAPVFKILVLSSLNQ